jgi:hypothetical protein
MLNEIIGVP